MNTRSDDLSQQRVNATKSLSPQSQIIVRGSCERHAATFFVDTGSSVSLISKQFVDCYGLTRLMKRTELRLRSFTSDSIKTYGEVFLQATIAGRTRTHKFIVTDLVDTHSLLGLDFLQSYNLSIDVPERCLRSSNGTTPFLQPQQLLKNVSRVKCSKTVTIPPDSIQYITGKAEGVRSDRSYSGFVEPKASIVQSHGLIVESSLCHTDGNHVPIKIVNLTD